MLIAQISDIHFLPKGMLGFGRIDIAGCLERAIEHLNALQPRPDAVLITGDLTNGSGANVWAELLGMLARLPAPIYPLPGNHDDREQMRAACAPLGLFGAEGPLCFAVNLGPLRLIGLDSLITGQSPGRIGPEQLAWLDASLAEAPTTPTLVALHHPPFRTGIDHMDAMMLLDGDALAAVIGRHPQVERVLCGHVHRMIQCRFAGTVALITPGVAHAVQLTLTGEAARWVMEPPGMLLHEWRDRRGLVSQLHFISDYEVGLFSDPHTWLPDAQSVALR